MIISRTPVRLSFFGGGTDYREYFSRNKGAVLGSTINKYIYISVNELSDFFQYKIRVDGVFMDVDDIRRGDDFSEVLEERLRESDVLLAVIGKRWLTLTDAAGRRRLDNDGDWVRSEVRSALAARHLVIPVLVSGASLPGAADLPEDIRSLAAHQAAEVRDGAWGDDVSRLCRDIERRRARGSWRERLLAHRAEASIVLALALAAGGYSAYTYARTLRTAVPLVTGLSLDRASRGVGRTP